MFSWRRSASNTLHNVNTLTADSVQPVLRVARCVSTVTQRLYRRPAVVGDSMESISSSFIVLVNRMWCQVQFVVECRARSKPMYNEIPYLFRQHRILQRTRLVHHPRHQ